MGELRIGMVEAHHSMFDRKGHITIMASLPSMPTASGVQNLMKFWFHQTIMVYDRAFSFSYLEVGAIPLQTVLSRLYYSSLVFFTSLHIFCPRDLWPCLSKNTKLISEG